ncbi:MAG: FxsA family protein [Myxococcota bacterium]
MGLLFLLFIVVPAVELALLAEVGSQIGWLATIALIVVTGFIGAALTRVQGFEVLKRIQTESAAGRVPADAMVDGALVLFAGALLLTPGILTDAVGFALLLPPVRAILKKSLSKQVASRVSRGDTVVFFSRGPIPRSRQSPSAGPAPSDPDRVYEAKFDDD